MYDIYYEGKRYLDGILFIFQKAVIIRLLSIIYMFQRAVMPKLFSIMLIIPLS